MAAKKTRSGLEMLAKLAEVARPEDRTPKEVAALVQREIDRARREYARGREKGRALRGLMDKAEDMAKKSQPEREEPPPIKKRASRGPEPVVTIPLSVARAALQCVEHASWSTTYPIRGMKKAKETLKTVIAEARETRSAKTERVVQLGLSAIDEDLL